MPSLPDKFKALGIQVGARGIQSQEKKSSSIEEVIAGRSILTSAGETFLVEKWFPGTTFSPLDPDIYSAGLEVLGHYTKISEINQQDIEKFAFIDTETTGLSGGEGTLAFLIGAGKFVNGAFHFVQFFLRSPGEEAALLDALEEFLASCRVLVTFNGKSFDVPLLNTRFLRRIEISPLTDLYQVDLLHLSRRLWRDRLLSHTLRSLEVNVLNVWRGEEDIPGEKIPQIYFDYLFTQDPTILKGVFYHNEIDVLSMVNLFYNILLCLGDPISRDTYPEDIISIAKFYEDIGNTSLAIQLYKTGLQKLELQGQNAFHTDYLNTLLVVDALNRLGMIYKHQENYSEAMICWEKSAKFKDLVSHEEIAKYYEHKIQDIKNAYNWTLSAIELIQQSDQLHLADRHQWLDAFEYRKARLESKLTRLSQDR